jgi:hypothetical protein
MSECQGLQKGACQAGGVDVTVKGPTMVSCDDGAVLYFDYINSSVLIVVLYYSFVSCYH